MCTPAASVLWDQCEMEGSKKKPQKKATDKQVPEGSGRLEGETPSLIEAHGVRWV